MGGLPLGALLLPLALAAGPDRGADAGPGRPRPGGELNAEDARYLDWLIEDFLFDPRGAVRVRLSHQLDDEVPVATPEARTPHRDGWLARGTGRVYFAGGDSIPVPAAGVREVDYEAECDRLYTRGRPPPGVSLGLVSVGTLDPLADAAWLHRRGYGRLAARALAAARASSDDPEEELRTRLAQEAARAMFAAFARRADAAAEEHGRRAVRLSGGSPPPPVADVLTDLERRRRAGTFGKPAPGWPAGFAGWDDRKKAAYLIATLNEIGPLIADGLEVTSHPRYEALVDLGDAAVPGLLDALEADDRLTRFLEVHVGKSGRHLRSDEYLVGVRDVARLALRQILRVDNLEPRLPEEDDDRTAEATLARYRRYWAAYGHLPFDDRMLAVLTDPACRSEARAEAAEELADRLRPGGRAGPAQRTAAPALRPDRARVVDAILAALDEEREREGRRRRPSFEERYYLRALVRLGDPRAGPEMARRATEEATVRSRVAYAQAAHDLGASGPLVGLGRELAAGTLDLFPTTGRRPPANRSRRASPDTLGQLLVGLTRSNLPEAEAALAELADPAHPYHRLLLADLLAERPREYDWASHPFVLGVLRGALGDRRPTGVDYFLRGDEVEVIAGRRSTRHPVPAGAAGWREHAEERVCDAAAARLSELAVGLPAPHPLRPDADAVLADLRATLLRYDRRFRPLSHGEASRLSQSLDVVFGPDLRPPGRPATAADVRAGRAVFELGGRGRVAEVQLPAWVLLKADAGADDPPWGLVVQAEVGPDGVVYGVIFRHAVRAVRADEVERVDRP